jgi:hypothetical protein
VGRSLERGVAKEGLEGGEPQIPAANAQTVLLQATQKRHDQRGVNRLEVET